MGRTGARPSAAAFLVSSLFTFLVILVILAPDISAASGRLPDGPSDVPASGFLEVESVIDGDTISVRDIGNVRYIGIDTPETGKPLYGAARTRNMELIAGGSVRLEFCTETPRDKYGRLLAWVYAGGRFVNGTLVREGLAKKMLIPPCAAPRAALIKSYEREARARGLGMWGRGGQFKGGRFSMVETIPAGEAIRNVGRSVRVVGKVSSVNTGESGFYIHLHVSGPKGFSAVILKEDLKAFVTSGLTAEMLNGEVVAVTGSVWADSRRTGIFLHSPEDIELLR